MDDFTISGGIITQTLQEIERINLLLGGNSVTIDGFRKLIGNGLNIERALTVADLGCGGGAMSELIWLWAEKRNVPIHITGIDANPHIIDYCRNRFSNNQNLSFECFDVLSKAFSVEKYDIITATLFIHHFSNDHLIALLKQLRKQANIGIVINDLHRHWFAYYSIKVLTKLFSNSEMVKYDAPLSVLRAFTKKELVAILKKAGFKNFSIKWRWAFRWQITIFS